MFGSVCVFALVVSVAFAQLPTSFDARQKWPGCANFILNQQQCGSCWDFCSVESFADRMCITGEAPSGTIISPEPILDCSLEGCSGGNPINAWHYLINKGGTTCTKQCFSGCAPYDSGTGTSPACHHGTCDDGSNWPITYYAGAFNGLAKRNVTLFQTELSNNGPLQACFTVYENFYSFFDAYPTGVYSSSSGNVVGGHCVKLIGWGEDSTAGPYWLLANSWDYTWADNGYFRMSRGSNLCGIEGQVSEGLTKKQAAKKQVSGIGSDCHMDANVGGWQEQDVSAPFVVEAAHEALRALSLTVNTPLTLSKIVAAKSQVVAGINFSLVLATEGKVLKAKVHRSLKNEFSVLAHEFN